MEFSEKLRFVREKLNISQEELARELNVSYASIHRWEHSKTKPIRMAQSVFYAYCESHGIVFNENETIT